MASMTPKAAIQALLKAWVCANCQTYQSLSSHSDNQKVAVDRSLEFEKSTKRHGCET